MKKYGSRKWLGAKIKKYFAFETLYKSCLKKASIWSLFKGKNLVNALIVFLISVILLSSFFLCFTVQARIYQPISSHIVTPLSTPMPKPTLAPVTPLPTSVSTLEPATHMPTPTLALVTPSSAPSPSVTPSPSPSPTLAPVTPLPTPIATLEPATPTLSPTLVPVTPSPAPTPSLIPTPLPTPNATLEPTQSAENLIPESFTGFGGDYALTHNGSDGSIWDESGYTYNGTYHSWVQWASTFEGYTTTRLGFKFSSTSNAHSLMDYKTLDATLDSFNTAGSKIILANFDYTNTYWDSAEFRNNWLDMTTHYKGDNRFAAFELFNEMHDGILNGHSNTWIVNYFADLTKAIHEIDPDRVVMFPTGQLFYDSASQWLRDLAATGIQNEPNVAFDIMHPYYFENSYDMGLTPEGKAQWYTDNWILPCVSTLGASRLYVGETFAWIEEGYHADLQGRWLRAIICECAQNGVSFNLWCGLGVPGEMAVQISAIQALNN